jgi:hypothetical protein
MIRIVGDINFTDGFFDTGFGIGSYIKQGKDPFVHLNRDDNDFWIGNCECVIADTSNKKGIYGKQFIISPKHAQHIQHLNLYNVANNHVMQHGVDAYSGMLQYFQNEGVYYVGSLENKSITITHQQKIVGIVAFSQREEKYSDTPLYWYNPEYLEIQEELNKISNADFKIAYIHWGNEFIDRPYVDQKKFARWLIDMGFDLVVGLHPHVLQGYEMYKDKYIFYSLGNFVFNMPFISTGYSIIINIDFDHPKAIISFDYVHIDNDYFPRIVDAGEIPEYLRFDYLNHRLMIEQENETYYKEVSRFVRAYRKANCLGILRSIHRFKMMDMIDIAIDFIKRRLR